MISWGPREAVAASGSSLGGRSPYGVCYVGGSSNGRLSLHSLQDGKRLTQGARPENCICLTRVSWRIRKEERHSSAA